jgi:hypothetical protein
MAKKRYHQSTSDRMSESRGMEKYETKRKMKKGMSRDDSRRYMEDSGMIREDHSAIANLPQSVIMREYPKVSTYAMDYNLNDTASGIDRQMYDDAKKTKKEMYPEKY